MPGGWLPGIEVLPRRSMRILGGAEVDIGILAFLLA